MAESQPPELPEEELLGAWALGALEPEELTAMDDAVRLGIVPGDEARGLAAVVTELDADLGQPPPAGVRSGLLESLRPSVRRGPRTDGAEPAHVYLRQAARLHQLLAELGDDDWERPAAPYRWSVHGLVAHLLMIERQMVHVLDLGGEPVPGAERDHLATGEELFPTELQRAPGATVEAWWEQVGVVGDALATLDLERDVRFHEWVFATRTLFVVRAFELWTHADDIRRAVGRPLDVPPPQDLATMSDTSVRSLPVAVHLVTDHVPDAGVRVVLTGDGGGTWTLSLGDGGAERATIVADVVDYCRLVARRVEPVDMDGTVEGDAALADRLLAAASVVAI